MSLDGASRPTFNRIRVLGEFDRCVEGIRHLREAGVPIEINFSPTKFNIHEIGAVVDLACELGAYSFYTGRTMYTGNAVKAWRHLEVSDEEYEAFFDTLRAKAVEYNGRMRVYFHEAGLLEELRYRLHEPAALAHRAAERPRQADQRAAVHLRRPAPRFACLRLVELPARLARPARREFRRRSRARSGQDAHAARMGPSLTAPDVASGAADAAAPAAARGVDGALPVLPVRGPPALPARRRVGVGAGRHLRRRRLLERPCRASCSSVIGVEAFNEYFDARMGTDRVFNPADLPPISDGVFWCGVVAFAAALAVGRLPHACTSAGRSSPSRSSAGWPRSSTRRRRSAGATAGLGELVIALSYGPWMVLGSLYLHTHALSWGAFAASFVPGLLIMSLAVVNAIPDYHQDLLVGKRNLVVRLGRAGGVVLYLSLAAAASRSRPPARWPACSPPGASPRCSRFRCSSRARAAPAERTPRRAEFVPAIRSIVACYAVAGDAVHPRRAGAPAVTPAANRRIASTASARRSSCPGSSRATATSHASIAAPIRRRASACPTSSTPAKRCASPTTSRKAACPYVMLCGGEPLVVPHFFAVAEALGRAGVQLKVETNGQQFDAAVAARLARLPIRSIQVSLDGDTQEVYGRQRAGASLAKAHAACRAYATPACRSRSRSRPPGSTSTRPRRSSRAPANSAHSASTPAS